VLSVACSGENVYGTLCGLFGKDNLYEDACAKWMKVYDQRLHKKIVRSVTSFLRDAKRGMGKHEWIEKQSQKKDITLGHVYAQLQSEGYVMHRHIKKCVRSYCMDWMNNPYTEYDTQCAVYIQRWYRRMHARRVLRVARNLLCGARDMTRMRNALHSWHATIRAVRIIQRACRAHLARCAIRRLCCRWLNSQFTRRITHYYSPHSVNSIKICQRVCRRWLVHRKDGQGEYVCI
jgi:hypothetical protein